MASVIIYVALVGATRMGTPRVGAQRWDVPIPVPDKSQASFGIARDEAKRLYLERYPDEKAVVQYGAW